MLRIFMCSILVMSVFTNAMDDEANALRRRVPGDVTVRLVMPLEVHLTARQKALGNLNQISEKLKREEFSKEERIQILASAITIASSLTCFGLAFGLPNDDEHRQDKEMFECVGFAGLGGTALFNCVFGYQNGDCDDCYYSCRDCMKCDWISDCFRLSPCGFDKAYGFPPRA